MFHPAVKNPYGLRRKAGRPSNKARQERAQGDLFLLEKLQEEGKTGRAPGQGAGRPAGARPVPPPTKRGGTGKTETQGVTR